MSAKSKTPKTPAYRVARAFRIGGEYVTNDNVGRLVPTLSEADRTSRVEKGYLEELVPSAPAPAVEAKE